MSHQHTNLVWSGLMLEMPQYFDYAAVDPYFKYENADTWGTITFLTIVQALSGWPEKATEIAIERELESHPRLQSSGCYRGAYTIDLRLRRSADCDRWMLPMGRTQHDNIAQVAA
jgi:hypothetical protein